MCVERLVDLVLQAWGVPTGHDPQQLRMAEFCACKSVDVIMNIDLGAHARNTAKETAKKRSGLHLQPDDDGGAAEPAAEARAPLEFEKSVDRQSTKPTSRRTRRWKRWAATACWSWTKCKM